MGESSIEWTDETWNPVVGCSKVSPGCAHCYAEGVDRRFRGADWRPWTPEHAAHNVRLHPERLQAPLHWRRPRMVFVNSMSDLFHEAVPDAFIADVFTIMHFAPEHTFQVLTKRPERMRDLLTAWQLRDDATLPNVWLGVSIENQRHAYRAGILRDTPGAAVRFVSAEPLLGPLVLDLQGIDWLIVGGESGPGARPRPPLRACHLEGWIHSLVLQGEAASETAVFVKQLGAVWARERDSRGPGARHVKGGDPSVWPEHLRVRDMPAARA